MNSNTIKSFSQSYPTGSAFALPASFTTTSSTETAFLLSNGSPAIITLPQGTEILGSQSPMDPNANQSKVFGSGRSAAWAGETAPYFNASSFNGRPFRVRASGVVTGGGTTATSIAATIAVYAGNITTVTSGTKFATLSSGATLGNVSAHWAYEGTYLWDSLSSTLTAVGLQILSFGTAQTAATTTTVVASANLTSCAVGLTWTFATTSTSNAVQMIELSIEQV